ncbi:hypothetical protein KPL71_003965 [Citrus sinensis]|uniref:Uncharacterized protein n=1 Tax=Citrus sinensis TaxID=2711 RepID=A0ACB8N295_CITSI|nr:hypothetical protein KPL71_003965 [Citrus sinensis]
MGSCVSSAHKRTADSAAAMKMDLSSPFGSNSEKLAIPPSPVKQAATVNAFRDLGSKEETFFDSQPWLDSDCEDDFYSVNGDFTPSRGNTPVHHNFAGAPQVNSTSLPDKTPGSISEPSPTGKKPKLAELFRQISKEGSEDQHVDEQNTQGSQNTANGKTEIRTTILDVLPSANGTPYVSGVNSVCSSERTPNGDSMMEDKPMRLAQCCLPSFVSCRNSTDRKKKMSPAIAVNG